MLSLQLGGYKDGVEHSNRFLQYPGMAIGAVIGGMFGMPGLGATAGQNAGLTVGDAVGGNWKGFGDDLSQNLPPGMQASGTGGVINTAFGLPLSRWFGISGD